MEITFFVFKCGEKMIPKHDEFVIENGIEKNLSPLFFFQVFTAILYLHTENTQKPAVDFF